ncbi:hypothetical protein ATANTOWER_004230 [Ataeniobius toweri]|uniref:Uncharacterized protein n=1 Tax=Ataeniobius toweri TaxID=208326 RepID=A0ABU7BX80_9TELE|nr:hypothetical protein [Ataeniobius toweri]
MQIFYHIYLDLENTKMRFHTFPEFSRLCSLWKNEQLQSCSQANSKSFCDNDNISSSQNISALSFYSLTTSCLGVWKISETAYGDRLWVQRDTLSGSSSL